MHRRRRRIATLAIVLLLYAESAPAVPAQDIEEEVASVIERICANAARPCSDLGRLQYVSPPERWAIREALAVLRHFLGDSDWRVRELLETPILTTSEGARAPALMAPAPARGAVLHNAATGEIYLLFDSTELRNLAATLHLLVVGNAVRSHLAQADGGMAETPATVGAQQASPESRCELQALALREAGATLKLVRGKLAGMGIPLPNLLAAFNREIEGNARELRFYLGMCGERA